MIKKQNGKWFCDITIGGRGGKRFKRLFITQAEAKRFEAHAVNEYGKNKDWNNTKKDNRSLLDLANIWYDFHGKGLKDGQNRLKVLRNIIKHLNNPSISRFTKHDFLKYRNNRTDITHNTINHHQAYLSAMLNELTRLDLIDNNPMHGIRRFKIEERELSFLNTEQITILLRALKYRSNDAYICAKVCLSTGTRWSEAVGIKPKNIKNNRINLSGTKNGKVRQLPISEALATEIKENAPFKDGYSTFNRVMADLDIDTPKGQLTHILRHSFASHFMMNGGDILTLQKTLGHSDLKMTMRYAHLSPEHLEKIITLNPLFK